MWNWSFFKKKKVEDGLIYFQITFQEENIFGVTAASASEAEAMVCGEIFHNQTIPGIPTVETLSLTEVKQNFKAVSLTKVKQKGIWFSS